MPIDMSLTISLRIKRKRKEKEPEPELEPHPTGEYSTRELADPNPTAPLTGFVANPD